MDRCENLERTRFSSSSSTLWHQKTDQQRHRERNGGRRREWEREQFQGVTCQPLYFQFSQLLLTHITHESNTMHLHNSINVAHGRNTQEKKLTYNMRTQGDYHQRCSNGLSHIEQVVQQTLVTKACELLELIKNKDNTLLLATTCTRKKLLNVRAFDPSSISIKIELKL